jgi:UDP-glucose 4-epimerase
MAILVTGAAGYIGSHTMVELLNAEYELVALDNFSNSKPEVLKRVKEITQKDFEFYEADLLDEDAVKRIFEENDIEAVIHFAGYKAVGESVAKPIKYYHNNITGSLVLCGIMQENNVKKIVYSSSATVYGLNNPPPFKEDFPLSATNPYGSTKLMVEQILTDVYNSDNEWRIALLRYFNPIGAHPSGRIGEDPKGIPNNLMPYITQVAVGRREKLNVFGNDYDTCDGTGVRDYIHVVDLAKGHLAALKRMLDHAAHMGVEAYNLGTGKGYSVLDVVKSFEEASGVDIPYEFCSRRPGDIASCYADVSKAYKELGWKTEKNILDMCRDSWNWQKNNPEGYI